MQHPWLYKGQEFDLVDDHKTVYGFVYIITNVLTGRQYIGKKFFWQRKSKQVKGKRKKYLAESDWRDYYGSNAQLLADVQQLGPENFTREIIRLCRNKAECAYYELRAQIMHDALISEQFYNEWITIKIHSRGLKGVDN